MCILSHVTACLVAADITSIKFPRAIEKGASLIGHHPSRMKPSDLAKMQAENKTEGPIMADLKFHETPLAQIDALEELERLDTECRLQRYFYEYSSGINRGFDCLPNAINYALRTPYFTRRELVVKVM